MNKILLIVKREYFSRVRKKSFIIMTILGPLLLAGIAIVPIWLSGVVEESRKIIVVDDSKSFYGIFKNSGKVTFDYGYYDSDISTVRKIFKDSSKISVLYIPSNIANSSSVTLFSHKQPGLVAISAIEHTLSNEIEKAKLTAEHIDPTIIERVKTSVSVLNKIDDQLSETGLNLTLGLFTSIIIYMFIFIYSAQVMRGVIEEKTNRIVEVIISSVKPFQLMMGKIVGVAMVGLTQFIIWIVLTFVLFGIAQDAFMKQQTDPVNAQTTEQVFKSNMPGQLQQVKKVEFTEMGKEVFENIMRVNWTLVLCSFIFYFLFGYLLYSALFAAIGSSVDNETDVQQFMLPVTIPLIFSFVMLNNVIENPDGPLAFWLSIIPLTSPIIMMMRIPFGIPAWQLGLSMSLLILGFVIATWLAGRIYRTGILMYGKKVTYGELWKWLFYKG